MNTWAQIDTEQHTNLSKQFPKIPEDNQTFTKVTVCVYVTEGCRKLPREIRRGVVDTRTNLNYSLRVKHDIGKVGHFAET